MSATITIEGLDKLQAGVAAEHGRAPGRPPPPRDPFAPDKDLLGLFLLPGIDPRRRQPGVIAKVIGWLASKRLVTIVEKDR